MSVGHLIKPSAGGAADGVNIISAGTQVANTTGTVVFSNSNGISFGMSNSSVVTASHNALTSQSNQALSAGNGSFTFQTATFADSHGISFSTGTQGIYASHNALTSQSNQALSGSNGSFTFQTATFGNSNGMSFYTTNGSVVGSYTVPTVTNSSWTASDNATSMTIARLAFTNSNGMTMTLSTTTGGSATLIASYTVPTVTNSSWTVSDNATSGSVARLAFTNLNGVTLSLSTGAAGSHTIVGSHNALTSQSNQALSGSNGSFTFQTATFGSSNGMHFYSTNGSLVGSYTVPTVTNSSWTVSDNATSGSVARLAFTNLNGVTLSLSSGAGGSHTIVGSHNALTSQSNQAFSAAGGSSAFQTLSFGDTNGVSFTNTNGSVGIASVKLSMFAVSNTTQSSSGTANHTALSFAGAGGVSVGVTNGSVIISGGAGGAGDGVNIIAAGTQTADTTGTVVFSNSNGVSFGMSDSSVVTASWGRTDYSSEIGVINSGQSLSAALGQNSICVYPHRLENNLSVKYLLFPILVTFSSSAASSGQIGRTWNVGVYTKHATNQTVLTLHYSTTHTMSGSYSSNASMRIGVITGVGNSTSYNSTSRSSAGINMSSSYHGVRYLIFPMESNFTPGDYWIAIKMSSSTAGTTGNCLNISHPVMSHFRFYNFDGATSGTFPSMQGHVALGYYSVSSAALPGGISFTQLRSTGGSYFPCYALNTTIN